MRPPVIPTGMPTNIALYLRSLAQYVEMVTRPKNPPPDAILMSSPDKSVWEIRVDDAGVVVSTKVSNG